MLRRSDSGSLRNGQTLHSPSFSFATPTGSLASSGTNEVPARRKRSRVGVNTATGTPTVLAPHISDALVRVVQYCCDHLDSTLCSDTSSSMTSSTTGYGQNLGPHLRERVLRDGALPVLEYVPDVPLGPGVECLVLLNCPVEQHPARKNHGQNTTIDYPGRYWANFTYLCHMGIFQHVSVNNLDKTLRWSQASALNPLLSHSGFPSYYCRDPVVFYKIIKGNFMILAPTISRGGQQHKTYYDKKDRAYHGDLLPYHIIVRVENAPSMPKMVEMPPLPSGVAPPPNMRQPSSDAVHFYSVVTTSDSDFTDEETAETASADGDESASSLISLLLTANSRNASSGNLETLAINDDHHEAHVSKTDMERAAILLVSDAFSKFNGSKNKYTYASIEEMNPTVVWPHDTLEATLNKLFNSVSSSPLVACLPALPLPFVGRHELVSQLSEVLTAPHDRTSAQVLWLHGEAGVGKSAVATAVARLCVAQNDKAFPDGLYYADVAFLRRVHVVNGIVSRILPEGFHVDEYGLNVWAAGLMSRCLVVVDNLERVEKLPADGLEWLWSWLGASSAHLTVIVTSRDPCPAVRPASVASLLITEHHLDRLSSTDAESLMYSLAQEADVPELTLAGGIRGPDKITRLASGVRIQNYARRRLPSSPDALAPSGSAGLALAVFDGVFDEAAANAVIGVHDLGPTTDVSATAPIADTTRASLLALCSEGALIVVNASQALLRWSPRWHDIFLSAASRIPANYEHAQDRLVHYSLLRIARAAKLWGDGKDSEAMAIIDRDVHYISKILLYEELRPSWMPLLLDVLLVAWPVLHPRFDHRELLRLSERIETVVVSQNVLSTTDSLLLVALSDVYAQDFDDALQALRGLPQSEMRVLQLLSLALEIQGQKLALEGQYDSATEKYNEALELKRTAERQQTAQSLGVAIVLEKLAMAHIGAGEYEAAMRTANEALMIYTNVVGDKHPATGWCYAVLANAQEGLEDHSSALSHFERALEILSQSLGVRHPRTATVVQNIGVLYAALEQYKTALKYHTDALERRLAVLGPDHLDTAVSHYNCGLVNTLLGAYDIAVQQHNEALRIRTAKLGRDHALTQQVVEQLVALTATQFTEKMLVI